MITVIDEYNENLYENMSVSDAATAMLIGVNETCNDLVMDCLLTEHVYLYETGTEISYVNEDGKENSNGKGFKEKVLGAIKSVGEKISALFTKIIDFIVETSTNIRRKLASIGMNEKRIDKAVEYISKNNVEFTVNVDGWAHWKIEDEIDKFMGTFISDSDTQDNRYEHGECYESISKTAEAFTSKVKFDRTLADHAKSVVLGDVLVKKIKKDKNEAQKKLKELERTIKSDKSAEDYSERLDRVTSALKSNSYLCSDLVKAYNKHYIANANIIKAMTKAINKNKVGNVKNSIKERVGNIKQGFKTATRPRPNKSNLINSSYDDEYDY